MEKRDLTTRVARWALLFEEYSYELEHRKGTRMAHVDALTRYQAVMAIDQSVCDANVTKRIQNAQQGDDHICAIREFIAKGPYNNYIVRGDVLYKYDRGWELIVLPEVKDLDIIRTAHEIGHFATTKTEAVLQQDFFIRKVRKKIDIVIRNCIKRILGMS